MARIILSLFLMFSFLSALETLAVLPALSEKEHRNIARQFRSSFLERVENNSHFALVDGNKMRTVYKKLGVSDLKRDNALLLRLGLVANAARIMFSEISGENGKLEIYVKIFDCQIAKILLVKRYDFVSSPAYMADFIYQDLKNNYWSEDEYRRLLTSVRLNPETMEKLERAGGTAEGYRLIAPYKVTTEQYRTVLLMGGSASELKGFLLRRHSVDYYLKHLARVYNFPGVR